MTSTGRIHRARTGPAGPDHRQAAAAMRNIGQRRHTHAGTRAHFVCALCSVSWAGAEADCWSCGNPATTEHGRYGAALQRLLTAVAARPATRRMRGAKR